MSKFASVTALLVFLLSPHISEAAFTVYSTPPPRIPTFNEAWNQRYPRGYPTYTYTPAPTYTPYTIPTIYTPTYPTYTAPRVLPIYIPRYTPTPTPLPLPITTPVPRKRTLPAVSKADRKAPDFIQNNLVSVVVERIFGEVFGTGRKIEAIESTYWKFRARNDKATESKLRETMKYFLANKWTYGNL